MNLIYFNFKNVTFNEPDIKNVGLSVFAYSWMCLCLQCGSTNAAEHRHGDLHWQHKGPALPQQSSALHSTLLSAYPLPRRSYAQLVCTCAGVCCSHGLCWVHCGFFFFFFFPLTVLCRHSVESFPAALCKLHSQICRWSAVLHPRVWYHAPDTPLRRACQKDGEFSV